MPSPRALAALAVLLVGSCAAPETPAPLSAGDLDELQAEAVEAELESSPAYAAYARERARAYKQQLRAILDLTLPNIRGVRDELVLEVDALPEPLVLASRDRRLRAWHRAEVEGYRAEVEKAYDLALIRIEALIAVARDEATLLAQDQAPPRSPLDAGPSGDPLLDRELVNFGEALEDAVQLNELDAQRQLDVLARVELVEYYNSFSDEGADAAIGGRLTVFVGGDELADHAQARIVMRPDSPDDLAGIRLFQAVRYRIMRGPTLVQDLGWRPMPGSGGWGRPEFHDDRYVVWSGVQPGLHRDAESFDQLREMRVVADMQTAVIGGTEDAPEVLGGVDWRLEFRVTFKGTVAWQPAPSASPAWNPDCEEVQRLLGVTDQVSDART